MTQFVHLHNHSDYSLLDGALRIDNLIAAAVADKMPAVALTDHGVMYGAIEFYKKALKAGIKPIVGMEAYILTKGSRLEKGPTRGRRAHVGPDTTILSSWQKISQGTRISSNSAASDISRGFTTNPGSICTCCESMPREFWPSLRASEG